MSKGISKGASSLRWLAPALGMGLLALISYTQATGPRRPAPDALAANQPAAARDGQTLAAVSPDGRQLASVAADGRIELRDLAEGYMPGAPLEQPGASATGLAYSLDGKWLAALLDTGQIGLFDTATGLALKVLDAPEGAAGLLAFSPDSRWLASGGQAGRIALWEAASGEPRGTLDGSSAVLGLAFSGDSARLVSTNAEGQAVVWDLATSAAAAVLDGLAAVPQGLDLGGSGKALLLAGISRAGRAELWELAPGGEPVQRPDFLQGQARQRFRSVAFSPDSKRLAGLSDSGTAYLWSAATGAVRHALAVPGGIRQSLLSFSPDNTALATADERGDIRVWDAQTGQLRAGPLQAGGPVAALGYSPDGKTLVSRAESGQVTAWTVQEGVPRFVVSAPAPMPLPAHTPGAAPASPQAPPQVAARAAAPPSAAKPAKGSAANFDAASAKPHWRGIKALALDPASRWIATGGEGGQLRILGADGKRRFDLDSHHRQDVAGVAFTADGARMVSIGRDSAAQVWNVATGEHERDLDGLEHPARTVAVSSRFEVAGAGEETRVVIWDGATGQMKKILRGHKDFVNALDFSPDGAKLASAGRDRSLIVWDMASGQPLLALPCQAEVNAVQFSPDGRQVAAATAAGTVLMWDAAQGGSPLVMKGHGGPVRGLAFSHDGRQLATAGADARIMVWEPRSGKLLKAMAGQRPVNALSFGQDGQLFEAGEDAQELEEWNANTGDKLKSVPLDNAPAVPPRSAAEPAGAWAGLFGRALDWLVPPAAAAVPAPPTGPVLVLTAGSSNFGGYYAEILRAEGLNAFDVADLSQLSPTALRAALDAHDLALLAPAALSPDQAAAFSDWVGAGGNLIAVRPDGQLAGLLGLAPTGQPALKDAYLLVDSSRPPGNGIGVPGQPMQFHGSADRYALNGAVSLANLYSAYAAPTAHPALSLRTNIGTGANRGQAAAFTYDLATSIVYTRQGNPAWTGQERDGLSPIRSDDKFFGNATTPPLVDPQPDWVDLDHLAGVPQADEQQRLLANLIGLMNLGKKPLPRFWYLPFAKKAAVVMTGDDHARGGTIGRFDQFKAASPPGCDLANWECVRGTSYVYPNTPMVDAQGRAVDYRTYRDQGFEIGLHVNTNCGNFDLAALRGFYSQQLASFASNFPGLTAKTQRHHCIAWSGWAIGATVQAENGIRLDTSYYFWPPGWVQDRPGYFNGSALPMRFADTDGTLLDNYLAVSHMTDESGQSYPYTIATLLDKAVGPEGYFGAYTINAHTDLADSPEADATVAAAQARGVPVVSAEQMLAWLDGRERSWFKDLAWDGNQLSFSIAPAPASALPNGLNAMVPLYAANGAKLSGLARGAAGAAVAYTPWLAKGVEYALFTAAADSYTATYAANTAAPAVDSVAPAAGTADAKTSTTVTATFQEAIDPASVTVDSFLLANPQGGLVEASVAYVAATRTAVLTPKAALLALSGYTATLKGGTAAAHIQDLAGHALPADYAWTFGVQAACSATPCTVWPSSAAPASASILDTGAVEVGVKFKSDIDGYIQGIRFYKGANNNGPHIGNLWSATGTRLATATFANETGSGWQQVNFASPVPITANTVYVASYYAPNGHYAGDNSYFSVGLDSVPLRLPSSAAAGGNGVYAYGPSSLFPDKSYLATNYWVDVAFISGAQAPLAISTANLPSGMVDTAYSATLQATGGTAPLAWSVSSGNLPAGLALDTSSGAISGTPTTPGSSSFTVQARDAATPANTASKALSLNVQVALAITTGSLPGGTVGTAYAGSLQASGGTAPYRWSAVGGALPPGVTLGTDGVLAGTPQMAGNYTFTAQVIDAASPANTLSRAFSLSVQAAAAPPAITTTALPGGTVGAAYSATLAATGGTAPLAWSIASGSLPPGLALDASSGAISGSPATAGSFNFTAQVTDAANRNATASLGIAVQAAVAPPAIATTSLPGGTVGAAYTATLAATGGTAPYAWSIASGSLPPGLALDASSGAISGSPATAGSFNFTAQVMDAANRSATASLGIAVQAAASSTVSLFGNATPATPDEGADSPVELGMRFTASVAGRAVGVRFYKSGANTGAHVGNLWSATGTRLATANFVNETGSGWQQVNFSSPVTLTAGTTYVVSYHAMGGHYAADQNGFQSARSNPPLSAPASAGVYAYGTNSAFPSQVWNNTNYWVDVAFVPGAAGNPAIATTALPGGTVGAAYVATLAATGGTAPYAWSIASGSLPPGLALNASSGAISGSPATAGSFDFTAQVTDAANRSATASLGIAVQAAAAPPAIATTSLPGGTVGAAYAATLAATGGTAPYAWSIASGSLPPGLALDASSGAISGSPATAGSFNFTAQVTDAANRSATASLGIAVQAAAAPPAIATTSLPGGTVGAAYTATLAATGGTAPYAWSIATGSLPPGLALDASSGAISGSPATAGSFDFTAQVTDAANRSATASLGIAVQAATSSTVSLFGNATPARADDGPDSPVELGMRFTASVAGRAVGVRFYKSSANTGAHVGNLWSATGTRLATATFVNETGSGWQQVNFSSPVPLTAGTTYVVSYHAMGGHYAADLNGFQSARNNPPLSAPASAGVYAYGTNSAFPRQVWNNTNYWVDVLFAQ